MLFDNDPHSIYYGREITLDSIYQGATQVATVHLTDKPNVSFTIATKDIVIRQAHS